ncbi:MAG: TRAP transporter substrate-binding protein [Alcaligenaceae bacterium]|nr:TRAP transporter substrate-binding protein [Alcaligenaceae bacterium]
MHKNYLKWATVAACAVLTTSTWAQSLPKANVQVVGAFSYLNATSSIERPFWTKTIPEASGGAITVDYTTLDQMGLSGSEILRLMRNGTVSFASADLSYMAADNTAFNALSLPGLLTDIQTARKAADAYKPVLDGIMRKTYNSHLLMLWPAPPQVIYCKPKIDGLTSLSGKKVRVANRPQSIFVEQVGAVPVTLPATEAVPALQRGTADCGITGTLSGNTGKWAEVTDYLMPLNLGYAIWFQAVNVDRWNALDKDVQAFLEKELGELENKLWANADLEAQDGINCNIGEGECRFGSPQSMKLVDVSAQDQQRLKEILKDEILPDWAKSCSKTCVEAFNSTVGKVTHVEVMK